MSRATVNLAEPYMRNAGYITARKPQRAQDFDLRLPSGTTVVSCDTHWEVNEDVFYDKFPVHLKDKAPRVWFDKYWHIGYKGQVEAFPMDQRGEELLPLVIGQGLADIKKRYYTFSCNDDIFPLRRRRFLHPIP